MLPDAYIVHSTTERLRIKIPSKRGDEVYFSSLKTLFSTYPGIKKLEVNPLTGSILFVHTGDTRDWKALAAYAQKNNLFQLGDLNPQSENLSWTISRQLQELENRMKEFTRGTLDFPGLVFLGLVSAGLFQILRGNLAPIPWYTAFWYGFSVYEFFKFKSDKNRKDP
ncbi:MAG TPA: hypothetical protein VNM22_20520 [Candidatus Limnocylindrales bacterium]|nr:hypothetical protein [Candidatus Limnocylindrales bacterium]